MSDDLLESFDLAGILRHDGFAVRIYRSAVGAWVCAYFAAEPGPNSEMVTFSNDRAGCWPSNSISPLRRTMRNDQALAQLIRNRADATLASLLIWLLLLGDDLDNFSSQIVEGMSARELLSWYARFPDLHKWRIEH